MNEIQEDMEKRLRVNDENYCGVRIGFSIKKLNYAIHSQIAIFNDYYTKDFRFCCKNNGYSECNIYDSYLPVVIKTHTKDEMVEDIIPIRKIPMYNDKNALTKEGLEIVFEKEENYTVSIFYDGFRQMLSRNEEMILIWYFLYIEYNKSNEETYQKQLSLLSHNLEKKARSIEKELEDFSIESVLEGLTINIEEHFVSKRGEDDRSYIIETVRTNCPTEKLDMYIKKYIGIGENIIYDDNGYTSAYKCRVKDIENGDFDEEQIKKEKERLINCYSRDNHIKYLLFDYIEKIGSPSYSSKNKMEKRLKIIERNTNFWIYWRIIRSKLFTKYFDDFDRRHTRIIVNEGDLQEANIMLQKYTKSIKELEELDTFEGIPQIDVF